MRVCIITDNIFLYNNIKKIVIGTKYNYHQFHFFFSSNNEEFKKKYNGTKFHPIDLKTASNNFFNDFDVFFSLHCKQLFPAELFEKHRCINVHPGYNPYNRGWYPQVFSILNKKPVGVTIHEIDALIDNGPIILQKQISINESDTSYDLYKRIQKIEISLLKKHFLDLVEGNYSTFKPPHAGNLNLKEDFTKLCKLDLTRKVTLGEAIDILRAGTFGNYKNLWFIDQNNNNVYVKISLKSETKFENDKQEQN